MLAITSLNGPSPVVESSIRVLETFLAAVAPEFDAFDTVFDGTQATGAGIDAQNLLVIIHGATMQAIRDAMNLAGGVIAGQKPSPELARRIADARSSADPTIADLTFGKMANVRLGIENVIDSLKSGKTSTPAVAAAAPDKKVSTGAKIAIGGAVLAAGAVVAFLIVRRR